MPLLILQLTIAYVTVYPFMASFLVILGLYVIPSWAPPQIFFPSTNSDQLSGRGPKKKKLSRTLTLIHPHPRPVENDHP